MLSFNKKILTKKIKILNKVFKYFNLKKKKL